MLFLELLRDKHPIEILSLCDTQTGIPSEEIVKYLFDDGFIGYDINEDTVNYFLDCKTIPELKHILRLNGLKKSGKKQELIERIIENNINLNIRYKSDNILLTEKSLMFLEDWSWIRNYAYIMRNFNLQDFFFYQFERDSPIKENIMDYLNEHMEIAMDEMDFYYILDCLSAKSGICKFHKDCEGYLDYEMKIFNLIFNPSILRDEHVSKYYSIDSAYIINFKKLNKFYDNETVFECFSKNWNFLKQNTEVITKSQAEAILKKILNNEKTEDIMKYIKKFYKNYYKSKQGNLDDYF